MQMLTYKYIFKVSCFFKEPSITNMGFGELQAFPDENQNSLY